MPYKDPKVRKEKGKEYSRKHYEKNKDQVKAATKRTSRTAKENGTYTSLVSNVLDVPKNMWLVWTFII